MSTPYHGSTNYTRDLTGVMVECSCGWHAHRSTEAAAVLACTLHMRVSGSGSEPIAEQRAPLPTPAIVRHDGDRATLCEFGKTWPMVAARPESVGRIAWQTAESVLADGTPDACACVSSGAPFARGALWARRDTIGGAIHFWRVA